MTYYYHRITKEYLGTQPDLPAVLCIPVETAPPELTEDQTAYWRDNQWVVEKAY